MYDLGASNEQLDPKIRIYVKNGVRKCYFQTEIVTGTKVNAGQQSQVVVNG